VAIKKRFNTSTVRPLQRIAPILADGQPLLARIASGTPAIGSRWIAFHQ
jgi:hypothetical protein